jgi:hypothetical protein
MNRCCQRQTQVFDVPVWRMISSVPRRRRSEAQCLLAKRASAKHYGPWRSLQADGDLVV